MNIVRSLRGIVAVGLSLTVISVAAAGYSGGTGEPNDPYQIATVADLIALGETPEDYDKHVILTADIDLDPNLPGRKVFDRAVIAPDTHATREDFQGIPFAGIFDGNGHAISHLTIKGKDFVGLFGQLSGEVKNLAVADVNTTGSRDCVGGLAGANYYGNVTDCHSTGVVSGTGSCIGGLVGYNKGIVTDCNSTGAVSGSGDEVGGLMGCNEGIVSGCCSTGPVNGSGQDVGGLIGSNEGDVTNCHSMGAVSSSGHGLGGLIGSNEGDVTGCYSTAEVTGGTHSIGGLVGYNEGGVADCHATGAVSGAGSWVGGLVGNNGGTVTDCCSTASVSGVGSGVGGLVGQNWQGPVTRCYSTGAVKGDETVGGLLGSNDGDVTDCHSTGAVSGTGAWVGGLVGVNSEAVTDCYSTGAVSSTGSGVGGLVGFNWQGPVTRCYSSGNVKGHHSIGGLVGYNEDVLTACYSTGDVNGTGPGVGGLVGDNGGTVTACYCTGAVSSSSYSLGGLIGRNEGDVTDCCSTGMIRGGTHDVGGLVGYNDYRVIACFWDTQTSGQAWSSGGTGKTTAEMQTAKTFLDAGWDFVGETANGTENIWWINEGKDYPRLSWEGPAGMVFVDIPAGTFQMGNHHDTRPGNATPVHAVTLDGFQIGKYETTNAQYAEYLNAAMAAGLIQVVNGVVYASSDANLAVPYCDTFASRSYSQIEFGQGRFTVRSREGKSMSDHPVTMVTWYGATAFCDYYGYHLPTEAQWEYAARGGCHDPYYRYPWGDDSIDCSKANCKTGSSFCNPLRLTSWPYTVPVGYYGPQGGYGLCEVSGNVSEWCQDWYDAGYYSVSPSSNPAGPSGGTYRVVRGGAWDVDGKNCDVEGRGTGDLLVRGQVLGFRVCR